MNTYHKIQTVFKRDMEAEGRSKPLIYGAWAKPEFEFLQDLDWEWYEKVDGTNIRVMYNNITGDGECPVYQPPLEFRGKQDKSDMRKSLMVRLPEILPLDNVRSVFTDATNVCMYGEGYGPKIQKRGGDYRDDAGFILFDIRIGHWWLQRHDLERIAETLNIPIVPLVGKGPLKDAIDKCIYGFDSLLRPSAPEGLIMKPSVELFNRRGDRVITKLKLKDFENRGEI